MQLGGIVKVPVDAMAFKTCCNAKKEKKQFSEISFVALHNFCSCFFGQEFSFLFRFSSAAVIWKLKKTTNPFLRNSNRNQNCRIFVFTVRQPFCLKLWESLAISVLWINYLRSLRSSLSICQAFTKSVSDNTGIDFTARVLNRRCGEATSAWSKTKARTVRGCFCFERRYTTTAAQGRQIAGSLSNCWSWKKFSYI